MMNNALGASGDYDARNKNILNKGDFYLGWVGAKWGDSFRGGPGTSAGRSRRVLAGDPVVNVPVPDP